MTRKQLERVRETLAAKCGGAANLIALTRNDPLRFFLAFGSTSGRFGGLGQADYSLASDLLAKMTDRLAFERPNCTSVCFHWPAWNEVGMAVRPESKLALERGGMTFMPVAEGVEHLIGEILAAAGEREILILDRPNFLDTDGTMSRVTRPADPAEFRADTAAAPALVAAASPPSARAACGKFNPGSAVDCSACL